MKTYCVIGLFYVQSQFFHSFCLILHIGCQHFQNKDIFSFIYLLSVPLLNIPPTKIYMIYKYAQKNKIFTKQEKQDTGEIKRKKSNLSQGQLVTEINLINVTDVGKSGLEIWSVLPRSLFQKGNTLQLCVLLSTQI